MKDDCGVLASTPSVSISIEELMKRDDGVGPFIWVRPQDVSGINASEILLRNLESRQSLSFGFEDEETFLEASVCSYLESCIRHRSTDFKVDVDDVIGACVYILVRWGSSIPAHSFYGDLDLLSSENASRVLKIFDLFMRGWTMKSCGKTSAIL